MLEALVAVGISSFLLLAVSGVVQFGTTSTSRADHNKEALLQLQIATEILQHDFAQRLESEPLLILHEAEDSELWPKQRFGFFLSIKPEHQKTETPVSDVCLVVYYPEYQPSERTYDLKRKLIESDVVHQWTTNNASWEAVVENANDGELLCRDLVSFAMDDEDLVTVELVLTHAAFARRLSSEPWNNSHELLGLRSDAENHADLHALQFVLK